MTTTMRQFNDLVIAYSRALEESSDDPVVWYRYEQLLKGFIETNPVPDEDIVETLIHHKCFDILTWFKDTYELPPDVITTIVNALPVIEDQSPWTQEEQDYIATIAIVLKETGITDDQLLNLLLSNDIKI